MDNFFYKLTDKLDNIRNKPETQQLNERDLKSASTSALKAAVGKNIEADKKSGVPANYSTKQVKDELKTRDVEEGMSRAAKGYEKYGKQGMQSLAKAGRDGKALDPVRNKYDKYDESVEEGLGDMVKKVGGMAKKVGGAVLNRVGHGDDADMIRDLQKRMGLPPTGKKPEPEQKTTEAAKYRDPKYKDKLYTQEPPDYTYGPDYDDAYDNPKPDDYEGRKRKIGSGSGDPLTRGHRMSADNSINTHGKRKGLPSRDQITGLKGSIKDAHGTHAQPNLPEAGAPMSTKQKSFAALAPPANKITFADKIAGAKKEVDEMLGDVAAEAMKSALSGGQKKLDKNDNGRLDANDFAMLRKGGKKETDEASQDNAFTAHKRPKEEPAMRPGERRKTHTGGEVEKTSDTSIRHHAGRNYSGEEDDEDTKKADKDDAMARRASGEKAKLGRKEGSKKRIGAKINTGTSKLMTKEGDNEGGGDLKAAMALLKKAGYKVSKAKDESEDDTPFDADTPKKNLASKQGMKNTSKDKDKDKEEVEETSHNAPAKSSSGVSYGKGIYDSLNRDVENAITESMAQLNESLSINMSSSTEGGKSLTVTATEEDAMKLAVLLKMSGLGSGQGMQQSNQACPSCGSSSCNCDQMDEAYGDTAETQNSPDYPTNTETSGNAMQYSGGIDGPKSTGQATVPVLASQEERQGMAEEIIGQPEFEHTGNAGYGSYGAAEYTATTKHRVGSHAYEVTTEQDGDGDFSYFIYENGKEIFSSIQPSNKNQLGHRISSALLDEHKKATAHLFDSDEDEDDDADLRRMMEMAGIQEAKKPDFLDMDKDRNKKEPMKKAIDDKDDKKVKESIFDLTNQWKTYKAR